MNFDTFLRRFMQTHSGTDRVSLVKKYICYAITFSELCRILHNVAHESDKVEIVKHCVCFMPPRQISLWLQGAIKICNEVLHGSDKVACIEAMAPIAVFVDFFNYADNIAIRDLLQTVAHDSDKLKVLNVLVKLCVNGPHNMQYIIESFTNSTYREVARKILENLPNKAFRSVMARNRALMVDTNLDDRNGSETSLQQNNNQEYMQIEPINHNTTRSKHSLENSTNSLLELEGIAVETKIEENQCAICMTNKKDIVFLPCSHQCCCIECARNLFETPICPLCKKEIKLAIKVFA